MITQPEPVPPEPQTKTKSTNKSTAVYALDRSKQSISKQAHADMHISVNQQKEQIHAIGA